MVCGVFTMLACFSFKGEAEELPRLSTECLEKMKNRDIQYNQALMKDIISNLDLDIDDQSYIEVQDKSLDAANLIYGGREIDEYYQSLHKQFIVASRGKPTLFIKPGIAYVLYKQPNNMDVAVHLKLSNYEWVVVEKKKKEGNAIPYKLLKCEREYLKEKRDFSNKD